MLHNRYLPDWAHRFANGAVGAALTSIAALLAVRVFDAPLGAFWIAVPALLCCAAPDPRRFSLVEGCAGALGYDELKPLGPAKRDDATWGDPYDA